MCFGLWGQFKQFVDKRGGNVVDLGVGIIIGGAFSAVVASFVKDILSPPLGLVLHGTNLENYFVIIRPGNTPNATYNTPEEAQADGAVTENVGSFVNSIINFLFIAFTLFWIVYGYSKFKEAREKLDHEKKQTDTEPCPWCKASVPKGAVKCQFCTSIMSEKIPPQYRREGREDPALIDIQ